jgi:hypothetical protein
MSSSRVVLKKVEDVSSADAADLEGRDPGKRAQKFFPTSYWQQSLVLTNNKILLLQVGTEKEPVVTPFAPSQHDDEEDGDADEEEAPQKKGKRKNDNKMKVLVPLKKEQYDALVEFENALRAKFEAEFADEFSEHFETKKKKSGKGEAFVPRKGAGERMWQSPLRDDTGYGHAIKCRIDQAGPLAPMLLRRVEHADSWCRTHPWAWKSNQRCVLTFSPAKRWAMKATYGWQALIKTARLDGISEEEAAFIGDDGKANTVKMAKEEYHHYDVEGRAPVDMAVDSDGEEPVKKVKDKKRKVKEEEESESDKENDDPKAKKKKKDEAVDMDADSDDNEPDTDEEEPPKKEEPKKEKERKEKNEAAPLKKKWFVGKNKPAASASAEADE